MPGIEAEIDFIDVPGIENLPVCCPIKYVEALVQGDQERCRKVLTGQRNENVKFGRQLNGHPMCPTTWDENSFALGMHGDGAATTNTEGLFTISWNSLHGRGTTAETKFVFACIKKSEMVPGTLEKIFDRLAWSMNALCEGVLPPRDWKGKPIKHAGRKLANGLKCKLSKSGEIGNFSTKL